VQSRLHPIGRRQHGLSLIEILVGVAIGIIGVLAIFQTVAVWSKHTQVTSAGGDAQVAGTLALFSIERDLKQAGHGFGTALAPVMGCDVQASGPVATRAFNFPLTPVSINPGAAGEPDEISVLYGNSSFFVDTATFSFSTPTTKKLARRNGFKPGDLAVIAGNGSASAASATCQLVEITADTNVDGLTVDHATGTYTSYYSAASGVNRFNTALGTGTTFSAGSIYDIGPQPVRNTWKILNGRSLVRSELIQNAPETEIAEGVVNLKAQYGIDADANHQISAAEWSASAPTDWTNVFAIRIAVLVRSRQFERNGDPSASAPVAVTASAPTWAGGAFAMRNVDGTTDTFGPGIPDPNNWRYYRYRVYERVIPFRNRLWN
jgi:type IV pilus assembly protein PilW